MIPRKWWPIVAAFLGAFLGATLAPTIAVFLWRLAA